jgi:hypothetical protein
LSFVAALWVSKYCVIVMLGSCQTNIG